MRGGPGGGPACHLSNNASGTTIQPNHGRLLAGHHGALGTATATATATASTPCDPSEDISLHYDVELP